jgi:hypothetical protein
VQIVDLTQPMANGMPVMDGIAPPRFRELADVRTDGYAMSEYSFVNHTGTHVDAPAHQIAGGATLDDMASMARLPARCRIVAPLKVQGANGGPVGATLGRHYGVSTYFALMATTASLGILFVYALVAIAGMVFFWKVRHEVGERYNVLLDIAAPLIAVAICGYTIYASVYPRPPAPITYSLWIALAWLAAGLLIVAGLMLARPDRVRSFGRAFEPGRQ